MSYGIYHDLSINAPIDKVFSAVSDPGHLINWWPLKCTGTPEIGSEYNFYFSPDYNWYGEVISFIPNQVFRIRMLRADADWNPTNFGFEMEAKKELVQLRFSHLDWPVLNTHYRVASFCWAMLLKGLKDYLEEGIILPFEERS